jgi:hypothetical protein
MTMKPGPFDKNIGDAVGYRGGLSWFLTGHNTSKVEKSQILSFTLLLVGLFIVLVL